MKKRKIPEASIRRLPLYYRYLELLQADGVERVSSTALSLRTGLTASQIRQDLSYFGEFGRQGYGYDVPALKRELAEILGMRQGYHAVVVGAGRFAEALVENFPFQEYGIQLSGVYDTAPEKVGGTLGGRRVYHTDELPYRLAAHPAEIGILTAPAETAKDLANTLSDAGVKGIWNCTNADLRPHHGTPVIENVQLFDSLFSMCGRMGSREGT